MAGEEQPLDIMLLLDTSGSMRSVAEKVGAAAHDALSTLRSADRVALIGFASDVHLITPLTSDFAEVERSIFVLARKFSPRGGTRIQDAVRYAGTRFVESSHMEQRRRAVLVVTDDLGRPADSEKTIIEDFWETNAIILEVIT